MARKKGLALFDPTLIGPAVIAAFKKLDPRVQRHGPVMFVVYVGGIVTTLLYIQAIFGKGEAAPNFILATTVWLWFTVLFANFAESLAEGRSKAQAASLRALKKTVLAKKLVTPKYGAKWISTSATELRKGMTVLVEAGDIIPADGEVIEGIASVDESAITGESAPVIRESGGDFSAVTGGTRLLSDWLIIRILVNPGETFIDRMIAMVESAKRRKTPNEIALTVLLIALTIIFLVVTVTLLPFSLFSVELAKTGTPVTMTVLIVLLVCLIPTTIGGLLSAIGVAGMSRMMQANVIATSGRSVEAAGDVDVLLLDKTGTITLGNRQAAVFIPAPGVTEQQLADAAQLASLADGTPEGRSIVVLSKQRFNIREREMATLNATFVPFTAQTRMSGADIDSRSIRKGAADVMKKYVEALGRPYPDELVQEVDNIARRGGNPLVVVDNGRVMGVITITLDNHQAAVFIPAPGVTEQQLADAAQLASLADETPEGRNIVVLSKQRFNIREREMATFNATSVPFSPQTRMSGVDIAPRSIRKGAADAMKKYVEALGRPYPIELAREVDNIARRGGTPLVVVDNGRVMGAIELKDIVKGGIKERFGELRRMGIKTVMITGDNKVTAAAIAAEAGVDDFLAEATPEDKLKLIRSYQAEGRLVAMTGDGTNDAPALAQADVAVAMNSGTQAAKEAGNMVDLDSNPTKLLEIVEIGKQMLMTRGSLTTFSIANDVAKYFAIIPAAFVTTYPQLKALDIMHLSSPSSAILAAVIFNALIIVALIPLALKGVAYRAIGAALLLRRNLLIYGLGGIVLPFIGIKLIDMLLSLLHF